MNDGRDLGFADKVALITGAGAGIGAIYAEAFASHGASVVVLDVDIPAALKVADAISAKSGSSLAVACDVGNESDVTRAVTDALEQYGGVDILVNNAGLHLSEYNVGPTTMDRAKWSRLFAVNVSGAMYCAAACAPSMAARGGGVIVNQSSTASYQPVGAYGVSKAALNALTHALAVELAPRVSASTESRPAWWIRLRRSRACERRRRRHTWHDS